MTASICGTWGKKFQLSCILSSSTGRGTETCSRAQRSVICKQNLDAAITAFFFGKALWCVGSNFMPYFKFLVWKLQHAVSLIFHATCWVTHQSLQKVVTLQSQLVMKSFENFAILASHCTFFARSDQSPCFLCLLLFWPITARLLNFDQSA